MQLLAGFDNPSTGSEMEKQAEADAVVSEERAEEETFSNSEPKGNSETKSEPGLLVPSSEPEDGGSGLGGLGDSDLEGELPLALPAKAASLPFRILLPNSCTQSILDR